MIEKESCCGGKAATEGKCARNKCPIYREEQGRLQEKMGIPYLNGRHSMGKTWREVEKAMGNKT